MKIINPEVEVLHTGLEKDFMISEQFIERVGRTCYKSEDKITDDSAAKFVRALIKRGHEAMLEHWTLLFRTENNKIYHQIQESWAALSMPWDDQTAVADDAFIPKIRFTEIEGRFVISGNVRAWRDFVRMFVRNPHEACRYIPNFLWEVMESAPIFFEDLMDSKLDWREEDRDICLIPITAADLEGNLEHLVHHDITLRFVCDRGVSHELVRHRSASFAQESTRYCNYASGKFGGEITVVRPSWCFERDNFYEEWHLGCMEAERKYLRLIDLGATPQQARAVLPNSLKTEVIMTGNLGHWDHFFGLRCAQDAHPDMREVACMAQELLGTVLSEEL